MNKTTTLILGLLTSASMVSCYPPQQKYPTPPTNPVTEEVPTPEDVNAGVDEQHKQELEAFQRENGYLPPVLGSGETKPPVTSGGTTTLPPKNETTVEIKPTDLPPVTPPVNTTVKPKSYPYARAVPGKDGFVYNPYTQSKIDVRGFASGTLVTAPGDSTQKFYVP